MTSKESIETENGSPGAVREGDLNAFEALFRQFEGEVYGWIVRIVRDKGIAEDLTVETFWRVYWAHARFHPERNFGAWARRIATNAALFMVVPIAFTIAKSLDFLAVTPGGLIWFQAITMRYPFVATWFLGALIVYSSFGSTWSSCSTNYWGSREKETAWKKGSIFKVSCK